MEVKVFTHNSLVTGIIAIVFGALLAYFQKDFISLFLMAGGGILVAAAIYEFIRFLKITKEVENRWAQLPFGIIFMAIVGVLLLVFPAFWVTLSEIAIAVLVMILALSKLMLLFQLKKNGINVGLWYMVLPTLLLIISIVAISDPDFVLGSLSLVFGIMIIAFGIAEIFDYIILNNENLKKKFGALSFQKPEEEKNEENHES